MEILSKSFFTYIDLAMDHFKMYFEVREKYLIWLSEFFELSDEDIKKWSKVGKGIDYYTFKHWIAKDNRFVTSKKKWPARNFEMVSHYHSVESVLEQISNNSYEDKLHFYQALSLLALVDKKYILKRIEFLNWTALALELDRSDCDVIREHVIEEFDLSFEVKNLLEHEKEDIFLCGVKMAHLSGEIIDKIEVDFLFNLESKLGLKSSREELKYFTYYLRGEFSENEYHSKLTLHKVGAILLNIIGSDEFVDKRESRWFKTQLKNLDNELLAGMLSNSSTSLIDGLSNSEKMLCYILGLEVSLRDRAIHKNEEFWLDYIYDSIERDFKLDSDLAFIFFEVINNNIELVPGAWNFFNRILSFLKVDGIRTCARWNFLNEISQRELHFNKVSSLLFREIYIFTEEDKARELINLSFSLLSGPRVGELSKKFNQRVSSIVTSEVEGLYGEMLICEILKISLLDHHIESLEEEFLREIQYRFKINDTQLHKVVFLTAFLIGRKVELSPRVNYRFL